MQHFRTGVRQLQRLSGHQQQIRCVGNASKLFPDTSAEMGGSYPKEAGEYGAVGGIPPEIRGRTAYIYAPARTASQQGQSKTATLTAKGPAWKIEFEVEPKWQNPLIGWTSTADPMEHVARSALTFNTKEAAVAFAIKSGFSPSVREPNVRRPDRQKRFAGYGDNFSVKRHGFPVGGMRSESATKKQSATEEQHIPPPDDATIAQMKAPSLDDKVAKSKEKKPRATKKSKET